MKGKSLHRATIGLTLQTGVGLGGFADSRVDLWGWRSIGATPSYTDLVSGSVFLRVGGHHPEYAELIEAANANPRDIEYKTGLIKLAWDRHRSLFAHEWAHIMQVASYPYLFLRAARQARIAVGQGRFLEANPNRYPIPLPLALSDTWRYSNMLSTTPVLAIFGADGIEFRVLDGDRRSVRGAITEQDLIEEDAQIFQYRAEIGSRGNGRAYRNWLREKPRYSLIFNLLTRHLGMEAAYRVLPVFVRAAFRTTRPLHAFFKAVGILKKSGVDYLSDWEYHDVLYEIVVAHMTTDFGEPAAADLSIQQPEIDDPPGVLDADFAALLEHGRQLPIAPLAEQNLRGEGSARGILTRCLSRPWEFFDRGKMDISRDLMPFLPPGISITIASDDFPTGATVLMVSPLLSQTDFPWIPDTTYAMWFKEVFRLRLLWKAVLRGSRGRNPNCPHFTCRAHDTGLCHGWFPIPADPSSCQFFSFFRTSTGHDVSPDGTEIVPMSGKENGTVEEEWM